MILCDVDIIALLPTLIPNEDERDYSLVNAASLDIRIGGKAKIETSRGWEEVDLKYGHLILHPGTFALVSTYERIHIPNGYAMDLRLKSSSARMGFNHSLAFWFDPGWDGYGTLEISNILRHNYLTLAYGQKFAQIIIYKTSGLSAKPYAGRYQGATTVEGVKPEKKE